jgi:hypothetical protein
MDKLASLYQYFLYNNKMEDNRHTQRQPLMVKRDCTMDVIEFNEHERTDRHGHIVDISKSGVGIESNTPMETGFVWFKERIWGQDGGVLLWSKQVGTQYRSGIRFAPLPHDIAINGCNQSTQAGHRESFKDVDKFIKMMLNYIKENTGLKRGDD